MATNLREEMQFPTAISLCVQELQQICHNSVPKLGRTALRKGKKDVYRKIPE